MDKLALISDLALLLIVAGLSTLLFKRLKQPLILGYLAAGFLIGPHWSWFPTLNLLQDVEVWAEIGIIFLLFCLGLEFNFKRLVSVGKTGVITALVVVLSLLVVGFSVAHIFGWNLMTGAFLGGLLAMSSTTIILKAFDDLGLKGQPFTHIVFGSEVVEDLVGILMMVLLSTIALSQQSLVVELSVSVAKLLFFLILWFIGGILIVPTLLRKWKPFLSDEMMIVISIGMCLGMVVLAEHAGFSVALGAFMMGAILGETTEAMRIEKLVGPIKDLFGAVFFVSVGMMADPHVIVEYWFPILILTLITLFGKTAASTIGVFISGKSFELAVKSGFSMGQIGEFAYIIAGVGLSLGVVEPFLYPVVIAVSVVTTITTPFMIKAAVPFYEFVKARTPEKYQFRLSNNRLEPEKKVNRKVLLFKYALLHSLVVGVMLVGVIALFVGFLDNLIHNFLGKDIGRMVSLVMVLIFMSPFLSALILHKEQLPRSFFLVLLKEASGRHILLFLQVFRLVLVGGFIGGVIWYYSDFAWYFGALIGVIVFGLVFHFKVLFVNYLRFERLFLFNYNEIELKEKRMLDKQDIMKNVSKIGDGAWLSNDLSVVSYEVDESSYFMDKHLNEINLRAEHGLFIIRIEGGGEDSERSVNIPGGSEQIRLHDTLYIVGKREAMDVLKSSPFSINSKALHFQSMRQFTQEMENRRTDASELKIVAIPIYEGCGLHGMMLKDSGISERSKCLVIGIERFNRVQMNPPIDTIFKGGSFVWVVGEEDKIALLIEENMFHASNCEEVAESASL